MLATTPSRIDAEQAAGGAPWRRAVKPGGGAPKET